MKKKEIFVPKKCRLNGRLNLKRVINSLFIIYEKSPNSDLRNYASNFIDYIYYKCHPFYDTSKEILREIESEYCIIVFRHLGKNKFR